MNEILAKELDVFENAICELDSIGVFPCPYAFGIIDFCREHVINTDTYIPLPKLTDIALLVFLQCSKQEEFLDCDMFNYGLQKYSEKYGLSSLINDYSEDITAKIIQFCE